MIEKPRTIAIDENLKKKLDGMKIARRESYNDLISRLVKDWYRMKKIVDRPRDSKLV